MIAAAEAESETAQLVASVGCGVVVPPGDPFALARAIRAAHDGEFDLAEMGRRARAYAEEEADRAIAIGRYEAVLSELEAAQRDRRRGRLLGRARRARLDARRVSAARRPLAARVRRRPVRGEAATPSVTVIVAAHDEEAVIERRLENLLALDYPADRLEIVVTSDASDDRTDELVEAVVAREPRVRLIRCPRGGKVAAQDRAVRETNGEIVAFSDANATWSPDALAKLVRSFADPEVAYVCGRLVLTDAAGSNREGVYWRFETWLRAQESALGSVTGGNGSIYAVRRADYVEVDPRFGHDLSLPYLMVQRGRRAVYDPEALALRGARRRRSRPSTGARSACSSTAG